MNTEWDIPWESHSHWGLVSCPTAPSRVEPYCPLLPAAPVAVILDVSGSTSPKGLELTNWKCNLSWQGNEADLSPFGIPLLLEQKWKMSWSEQADGPWPRSFSLFAYPFYATHVTNQMSNAFSQDCPESCRDIQGKAVSLGFFAGPRPYRNTWNQKAEVHPGSQVPLAHWHCTLTMSSTKFMPEDRTVKLQKHIFLWSQGAIWHWVTLVVLLATCDLRVKALYAWGAMW